MGQGIGGGHSWHVGGSITGPGSVTTNVLHSVSFYNI